MFVKTVGVSEAFADLESAVAKLVASEQRGLDLERLNRARNQIEAVWLREVEAFDRSGDWVEEGFVSAASAMRTKCRIDAGAAGATVSLARKLKSLPVLAEAFAAGDVSR